MTIAQADNLSPEASLERIFTHPALEVGWFADSFLSQVPLAQVRQVIQGLERTLGNYQGVQTANGDYLVIFERGTVPTKLALNGNGQIVGLLFQAPQLTGLTLADIVAEFQTLPGDKSLLAFAHDSELVALNPDQPLAVGSSFKLIVLEALKNQIAAGIHTWDEVVELQPEWRSLPSGLLQTWPSGAPITLQSLATLMISLSDNTATDALIHVVGRNAIEALTARNQPFLTTRSFFVLKDPQNQALLRRYRSGNEAERRQVIQETQPLPLPNPTLFEADPLALDVEWFFNNRELCRAIAAVADLPLMRIEPGVADPNTWAEVAFKGGSESGVINMTTHLKTQDGKTYCATATWNNTEGLDQTRFVTLYRSLLEKLS